MAHRVFDGDALLQARRRWAVTLGGVTYRARPVSFEAVLQYQAECLGASAAAAERALHALLRQAFPARLRYLWSGDPVLLIRGHPNRTAVLKDFFGFLRGAPAPTPRIPHGRA